MENSLTLEKAFEPYKDQEMFEQNNYHRQMRMGIGQKKLAFQYRMTDQNYVEKLIKNKKKSDQHII